VNVDERRLNELIVESQDLQSDALRDTKATLPALAEIGNERRGQKVDQDEIEQFSTNRRSMLAKMGLGAGGLATKGILAGGFGGLLSAIIASPVRADTAVDVQILQTASSLERLAVGTYAKALTLDFVKNSPVKAIPAFATETMRQHDEHRKAFQAQTTALGGKVQDQPNPMFSDVVNKALPTIKAPLDVIKLAATLEKVATDTYLMNLTLLEKPDIKAQMASVMGVEAQHLATLLAVQALLEGNAPQLIKIPIGADLANLPAAAGKVAFPKAFEEIGPTAPKESGVPK